MFIFGDPGAEHRLYVWILHLFNEEWFRDELKRRRGFRGATSDFPAPVTFSLSRDAVGTFAGHSLAAPDRAGQSLHSRDERD